jgi:cyclopropane-fatty-acyl-phospholipid synthase
MGETLETRTQELHAIGTHAYGSEELNGYEARLEQVFARSYVRARQTGKSLADLGISALDGPMVERLTDLMQVHYDEHLTFFQAILDRDYMAYSMAYYGETPEEARSSSRTLEEAQRAKFELFCTRARLQGYERILNIGCGFGSLETFLLRKYPGIQMVGVTPSRVQTDYLKQCMQDPDHPLGTGRFRLITGAFDNLPVQELGTGAFDVVFSVGVLEHFRNLGATFEKIAALLKPDGRAFHHLITATEVIPGFADTQDTRLRRYFPGGRIWPFHEVERITDHFNLEGSWFVNGINYWRTVDAWHERFWNNIDRLFPVLGVDGVRHWNEYFTFCKVMFAPEDGGVVGNGQYLFRKRAT